MKRKIVEVYINEIGNDEFVFEIEKTEDTEIAQATMFLFLEKLQEITEELETETIIE